MTAQENTLPTAPGPEVLSFLSGYAPEVQAIALRLRDAVLNAAPTALEQVDKPARMLAYGFAPTYTHTLCVIMPLKAAVNLGFPRGTSIADPAALLAGTGKRARHVKLTSVGEADAPALRALLEAALALTPR